MSASARSKIRTLPELKEILDRYRADGHKIVFANGCFDLIHVGHVRYLQGARREGDVLVVGINSDSSVRRLKGRGRPLACQADRAEIVASMECVDHVVVFDAATADGILLELKPEVHAKGTDYTEATVPERETVLSYGGRVAIVGDPKAHSTRDLIRLFSARLSG